MRVAVITWFHHTNYGTALQVYALQKALKSLGNSVDVIQYYPHGHYLGLSNKGTFPIVPEKLSNYSLGAVAKRVFIIAKKKLRILLLRENPDKKDVLFDAFIKDNLSFTSNCATLVDLEKLNKQYDAFVCGSDQIWSPANYDPHYFLDFVLDSRRKIAYAPSIGQNDIEDPNVKARMKKLIGAFQHISVRENRGAEIINSLTGQTPEVVCDPTMLLGINDWSVLANKCSKSYKEPYLLAYFLGVNLESWENVRKISKKLGLKTKIIPVFQEDLGRKGCIMHPVGPEEFLKLFSNASYICTDSFHGTLFACIFNKQFTVYERFKENDPINQNSRIYSLLDKLQLRDRLWLGENGECERKIDYSIINRRIDDWKEKSLHYLTVSLEEVKSTQVIAKEKHILVNSTVCCGCGACSTVCPVSAVNIVRSDGFLQAEVDPEICVSCGKCVEFCPNESVAQDTSIDEGKLYSYKSSDLGTLKYSSSGGFANDLSSMLINNGYSIIGCRFNSEKQVAEHILINSIEDLGQLQGSKYMQSDFSRVLKEAVECKTPIAVFGTPCQIAAAKRVLCQRSDVVYIDLICHGVPNYYLFEKYKHYLAKSFGMNTERMRISFRYKPKGWRERYIYATDGIKETCIHQNDDLYFKMFESTNCYMKSCYECSWRDQSEADLRIGDYWGDRFKDDQTGVSMVVAMTDNGLKLIDNLRYSNKGKIEEHSIGEYSAYQQTNNSPRPGYYEELTKEINDPQSRLEDIVEEYGFKPPINTYERITRLSRIKHTLKMMVAYTKSRINR